MKVAITTPQGRIFAEDGKEFHPTRFIECDTSYEYEVSQGSVSVRYLNSRAPVNFNPDAKARADAAAKNYRGLPDLDTFSPGNPDAAPEYREVPDYLLQGDGWGFAFSDVSASFDAILP